MSNVATRLLSLIWLLQSRPTCKAAELAEELGVSERTIHRYMGMLDEMGIPIYTERGPYGGFGLVRGYRLPPLIFTAEEATVLTMGAGLVRHLWGQTYQADATAALAKLHNVLPDDLRQEIAEAQRFLYIAGLTVPSTRPWEGTLRTLRDALARHRRVQIEYRSPVQAETQREVDPYGLAFTIGYWYLVGFCHLRRQLRLFRIDRILQVTVLPQTFQMPPDFSVQQYVESSAQTRNQGNVVVHLDAQIVTNVQERYGYWMRLELQEDGSALVHFNLSDVEWTISWVLSLGSAARLLEPPELAGRVRAEAEAIARRYRADGSDQNRLS